MMKRKITKWYGIGRVLVSEIDGELMIIFRLDDDTEKTIILSGGELLLIKKLAEKAYKKAIEKRDCRACVHDTKECAECDIFSHSKFKPITLRNIFL
jgi:hypothetical protein